MKKTLVYLCMATMLLGYAASADAGNYKDIGVDGATADWGGITAIGTDTQDLLPANANWDLKSAHIANNSSNLYTRMDVYGTVTNSAGHSYEVMFDTKAGGWDPGWGWSLVPDYRFYQDAYNTGLQEWMGTGWGWGGALYATKIISEAKSGGVQEWGASLTDLGLSTGSTFKVLWHADLIDSIPIYSDPALQYQVAAIPEPTSLLLLGSGLVGLIGFARKKK